MAAMAHPASPLAADSLSKLSSPSLYAEFLPKLGRISIVIHLPTPSTHCTKVLISADASRLLVYHERVTTELILPAKSRLAGEHLPQVIPPGLDKISWRLLPRQDELAGGVSGSMVVVEEVVPWPAAGLKPNMNIVCRQCEAVIVSKDKVKEWKDLPSENWAEMMEFWHCHKPTTNGHGKTNGTASHGSHDEKKASESELALRGYGANSAIVAQEGVGFVDLTKMLFHTEDCRGLMMLPNRAEDESDPALQTAQTPHNTSFVASCPGCTTQLGLLEYRKSGFSLWKWKVNFTNASVDSPQLADPPTLSHCLAAALIEAQARTGSAKIVLRGNKDAITVWILNPHIKFSCKEKQKIPAMKLLFQNKAMEEDEIDLPDGVIKEVREILQEGNRYLPPDEKTKVFDAQEGVWTVTLLERLERRKPHQG